MAASDQSYDEIIDKTATTPGARLILIGILKKEEKPEKAIKACIKALEYFPDDIDIRKLLIEAYIEQGLIEPAELELTKLCKQIDELASIFKVQAKLFKREGRIEEAINSLKIYLAHHTSDQEAAQLLSELSASIEKEPLALPTPTLAEIYYNQGEIEEAVNIYDQVVKAVPDDEKSKVRLNELKELKEAEERRKAKEGILRRNKLRIIEILEKWLANIEQMKMTTV